MREQGFTAQEAYEYMKKAKNVSGNVNKGQLVEDLMDDIMVNKKGYTKLPSKVEGNHGIDGVYVKYDKNGNIKELVIAEAKFGRSRLGKTSMGRQMSDQWIDGNINKMLRSDDVATRNAGRILDDYINNRGGIYSKQLLRLKKTGHLSIK